LDFIPSDSLVLYHGRPARVAALGDKLTIELEGGETARVRAKDVTLLHRGPLKAVSGLVPPNGDVGTAWELLAGSPTTIKEIAELTYGAYTPATAWAAWQLVAEGVYYRGTTDQVRAATAEEMETVRRIRTADAAEKQAWEGFLTRAKAGRISAEDRRFVRDVEDLAYGRNERSRVMKALSREESPENAHATLLEWGAWDEMVNPYPVRLGLNLTVLPDDEQLAGFTFRGDAGRRDLTHLRALAIDDAGTDTPDDALSWEEGPGLGRLWVHVADAAALIPPGSRLDEAARNRAVSHYLPESLVPMLPADVIPLLGLGLAEASPALSFCIDVGDQAEVLAVEIVPSVLQVERLTYESANDRIDEAPLPQLLRIAEAFRNRRAANGAVEIDLPEASVRLRDGEILITPVTALQSRVAVENAMILAGEAVARYAATHDIPLPYATQEAPDALAEPPPDPRALSAMYARRRTMRGSQYRGTPAAHSGLGLPAYAQSTSPLRRYLDLVVHQQLRAHLRGEALLDPSDILARIADVEPVVYAGRQAERLSIKHWTLAYLQRRPGWQGRGILVEKRGMNGTFAIPELALEAQVHLNQDLPLDSEVTLALRGVDLPRLDARFRILLDGGK
jgi:exoribonuclease II